MLHNETANIWSHLIPMIGFIVLTVFIVINAPKDASNNQNKVLQYVQNNENIISKVFESKIDQLTIQYCSE